MVKKLFGALTALLLVLGAAAAFAAPPSPDPEPCQSGQAGQHNKHCQTDPPAGPCEDGIDNEQDGLTDGEDPDCQEGGPGDEINDDSPPDDCEDGLDNDEDGLTDGEDPDCQEGGPGDEINDDSPPAATCSTRGLRGGGTIFNSGRDETGPVSGALHGSALEGLPSPASNAVHEGSCLAITVEDLV